MPADRAVTLALQILPGFRSLIDYVEEWLSPIRSGSIAKKENLGLAFSWGEWFYSLPRICLLKLH